MTNRSGLWIRRAIWAVLAIAVPAGGGCRAGQAGAEEPGADDTRGMSVEPGRLGLDHSLQVRQTKGGVPRELRDGAEVRKGDRIRASVVTSEDAYLYLAFCSDHQLTVYPSQAGIRTSAGDSVTVPEGGGDLIVDDVPGTEVLYLILSRKELSLADKQLAEAIRTTGQEEVDCSRLDDKLARPASGASRAHQPRKKTLRGDVVAKKPMPARPAPSVTAPAKPSSPDETTPPPDPDYIRKGDMVWYSTKGESPGEVVAADAGGIAIVRYRFDHVRP